MRLYIKLYIYNRPIKSLWNVNLMLSRYDLIFGQFETQSVCQLIIIFTLIIYNKQVFFREQISEEMKERPYLFSFNYIQ